SRQYAGYCKPQGGLFNNHDHLSPYIVFFIVSVRTLVAYISWLIQAATEVVQFHLNSGVFPPIYQKLGHEPATFEQFDPSASPARQSPGYILCCIAQIRGAPPITRTP
ncbi:MAG: hypothetical protein ACPG4N_07515, partial [Gammaproteobacteria bacterium]